MVKYSICIPAYKSRYLKSCIESILQQTIRDFELIILNDCSPEPIEAIVQQFEDNRIQYLQNDHNVGAIHLVENWNKCLSLAKGEYIMIMGDDDELEPDYLQEFSNLIAAYPTLNVYHCRSKIIDDAGQLSMLTPACPAFEHVYDSIWHRLAQYRSNYISDFVYRVEPLRKQGGFYKLPLAWGSDDITAFIATGQQGIAHTNKPVFRYRSNALSITSTGNNLHKMEANLGYAKWLRSFLQKEPESPEMAVVHRYLVAKQGHFMRQRKRFTMALSMRHALLANFWLWLKHRRVFDLSLKDIVVASIKSVNLSKRKS
ncbi:glycosyltransferase family 2 protein [Olivibacter sp. XZL3]|uniref:glycosyltransferase family 2 protein n=1 Tax=Olivibacter sp. XZL3 TaxID=1735116 RepID=UPI0010655E15|nr:glycosyltransferase family 2 protein [Olivibacter sp. XZL3]